MNDERAQAAEDGYPDGHFAGFDAYVKDFRALGFSGLTLPYEKPVARDLSATATYATEYGQGYSAGYKEAKAAHEEARGDRPPERDPKYVDGWNEGYQDALADAKHPYTDEPPAPDTDIDPDAGWIDGHRDGWNRAIGDMHAGVLESPEEGDAHPDDEWQEVADVVDEELVHIITVIGSYAWANGAAVQGALHQWWLDHDQPKNVRLITSGCPEGAEAVARDFATGFGWTPVTMRDEEIAAIDGGAVFAFIAENSPGAEAALEGVGSKVWRRVYREETHRPTAKWSSR